MFVSTWGPPMVGGPRNLWSHLKKVEPKRLVYMTCFHNFTWAKIDPNYWLPVDYRFFDYLGEADRSASALKVDPALVRYQKLDRFVARSVRVLGKLGFRKFRLGHLAISLLEQGLWIAKAFLATCAAIRKEKIDRLVLVSDMGWGLIGAYLAARWMRIPYAVYLFDLFADNYFHGANRVLAKFFERPIFARAHRLIVTNEETRDFYQAKYPKLRPAAVVYNSSDAVAEVAPASLPSASTFKLVFAGSIYWPHQQALVTAIEAIGQLKDEGFSLKIFTPSQDAVVNEKAKLYPNVDVSFVDQAHVARELAAADFLLLPFSWDTPAPAIVQTASPAKLGEYVAVAKPIWVLAPATSFISKFVKARDLGCVTNDPRLAVADLRAAKARLPASQKKWQENSKNCYREVFTVEDNARRLSEIAWGNWNE